MISMEYQTTYDINKNRKDQQSVDNYLQLKKITQRIIGDPHPIE